ncbi:Hint domain-containing protein [Falsihalocynthiibacter sp. SS001]|uniref:Hint domain-containing protein n=1 Tax=Falsihalocynthiibacter sp. SS001 TaxID=3349698 RepID=UPI0036D300F1
MVSIAPIGTVLIEISGDTTGFVTGDPPDDATGDLDATVTLPNPGWTYLATTWEISGDPGIGTATINAGGEWNYVVDPDEYADLDDGEIVFDTFQVTATAYALNPGGGIQFETQTQNIRIAIEAVCFVSGTLIDTMHGPVPVEDLRVNDMLVTRDNGLQPIRWVESNEVSAERTNIVPSLRPVRIKPGALGNGLPRRDLYVSQQHRIMVSGAAVQLFFGESDVLVEAKALCGWPGIEIVSVTKSVEYFHILLDHHEILNAEGAPAESLFLGEETLHTLSSAGLQELAEIFQGVEACLPNGFGKAARRIARNYEAIVLDTVKFL